MNRNITPNNDTATEAQESLFIYQVVVDPKPIREWEELEEMDLTEEDLCAKLKLPTPTLTEDRLILCPAAKLPLALEMLLECKYADSPNAEIISVIKVPRPFERLREKAEPFFGLPN